MPTKKTATIIYHRRAGRGKAQETANAAQRHLRENGWTVHGPIATRYAGHAESVLAPEWAPKVDLLAVVGGDGTLREVCAGLGRDARNVTLGFIPMGNANVIARDLKIPLEPNQAIKLLTEGMPRSMDAGIIQTDAMPKGGKLFLAMTEIGYGACVAGRVARLRAGRFKTLYRLWGDALYAIAGVAALFAGPVRRFSASMPDSKAMTNIGAAVFTNTATYAKNWSLTPEARSDDGRLDYMLRKRCDFLSTLRILAAAMQCRPLPQLAGYGRTKRVTITSRHPLPLQVDGDPLLPAQHLEIAILPNYLRIMTPA